MRINRRLANLLIKLGEDAQTQRAYADDAEAVMAEHGLSESERAALRNGDESAIRLAALGIAEDCLLAKLVWGHPAKRAPGAAEDFAFAIAVGGRQRALANGAPRRPA